jgi:hypothetical protein
MVKDLTKDEMEIACIGVQASQFMSGRCWLSKGSDANGRNVFAVTGRGPGTGTGTMIGNSLQIRIRPYYAYTRKLTQIISGNTDTNNKMEM